MARPSLGTTFQGLQSKHEGALVVFVTGGDPSLKDLPGLMLCLSEAGADVIEVGLPFSDPIADGPIIQASSQRALEQRVTPMQILETLTSIQLETPIVLMGYYNSILRAGLSQFAETAKAAGVSGLIISDLTPEEAGDWRAAASVSDLDTIFLVAPTSTDSRIRAATSNCSGFVYAVSRTGVTGQGASSEPDITSLVVRVKSVTDLPVCIGFGINTAEQVRTACSVADGAVVGSHLVQLVHNEWNAGAGHRVVASEISKLKDATRR